MRGRSRFKAHGGCEFCARQHTCWNCRQRKARVLKAMEPYLEDLMREVSGIIFTRGNEKLLFRLDKKTG